MKTIDKNLVKKWIYGALFVNAFVLLLFVFGFLDRGILIFESIATLITLGFCFVSITSGLFGLACNTKGATLCFIFCPNPIIWIGGGLVLKQKRIPIILFSMYFLLAIFAAIKNN